MAQLKLAIGFPAYGGSIAAEHAAMWLDLGGVLADSRERFGLVSFGYVDVNPVDRARNFLLATAMQLNADWLLSIDADTWVVNGGKPGEHESAGVQLLRMISDAERVGATLVSAPVVKRVRGNTEARELAVYTVLRHASPGVEPIHQSIAKSALPRSLYKVDAVGAACFALNLRHAQNYDLHYETRPLCSEDLDFCKQIRDACNGRARDPMIFVDGRVNTAHLSKPFPLLTSEL